MFIAKSNGEESSVQDPLSFPRLNSPQHQQENGMKLHHCKELKPVEQHFVNSLWGRPGKQKDTGFLCIK